MKHLLVSLSCLAPLLLMLGCTKRQPATLNPPSSNTVSTAPAVGPAKAPQSKEGAVLLRLKWPVGSRYVYRMAFDQKATNATPQHAQPVEQNVTMAVSYAASVLTETPEQGRELELEFLANEMEVKMAGQTLIVFHSKDSAKSEAQNTLAAPFRKMIGSKLHLEMDGQGKIEKVLDYDQWMNRVAGEGAAGGMVGQQFTEQFVRQIADFGRGLPANAVAVGDSWPFQMDIPVPGLGKIKLDLEVKFAGWEDRQQHHCAVLKSSGTVRREASDAAGPTANIALEDGRITGTTWFDPELGALVESTSEQSLQVKGEMPGQLGVKAVTGYTVDLGQKMSLALVEVGKMENR